MLAASATFGAHAWSCIHQMYPIEQYAEVREEAKGREDQLVSPWRYSEGRERKRRPTGITRFREKRPEIYKRYEKWE